MANREHEPNTGADQRELQRAQLDAVRSAFSAQGESGASPDPGAAGGASAPAGDPDDTLRTEYLIARLRTDMCRLGRKQRNTARVAAGLAVAVALGAAALVEQMFQRLDSPFVLDEISAQAAPEAPVVLALNAEHDPSRQLPRFAASKTGAGLTLEAPAGGSSLSLLSTQAGSSVEVRNGEQTERVAGSQPGELAPVSAGPRTQAMTPGAASEVPVWTPRSDGPPSGGIAELRGRMVDTTAVVHSGLAFRIKLGDASTTLTVPKISPGNSTGFRVTLPGASADPTRGARVE